jgi:hypothetical protein
MNRGVVARASSTTAGGEILAVSIETLHSIVSRKEIPHARISPRDLARAASIGDIVTRAISAHATPEMQRHYSTAASDEVRAGLAKVIDIATGRERRAA